MKAGYTERLMKHKINQGQREVSFSSPCSDNNVQNWNTYWEGGESGVSLHHQALRVFYSKTLC